MKNKSLLIVLLATVIIMVIGYNIINKQNKKVLSVLDTIPTTTTLSNVQTDQPENTTMPYDNTSSPSENQAQNLKYYTHQVLTDDIIKAFVNNLDVIDLSRTFMPGGYGGCQIYHIFAPVDRAYILTNNRESKLTYADVKDRPKESINFTVYFYEKEPAYQGNIVKTLANWFVPIVEASCKYDYIIDSSNMQKIVFWF